MLGILDKFLRILIMLLLLWKIYKVKNKKLQIQTDVFFSESIVRDGFLFFLFDNNVI